MAVQAGEEPLLGAWPARLVRPWLLAPWKAAGVRHATLPQPSRVARSVASERMTIRTFLPVWRACVPTRYASVLGTGCLGAVGALAGPAVPITAYYRDSTRCGEIYGCVIEG